MTALFLVIACWLIVWFFLDDNRTHKKIAAEALVFLFFAVATVTLWSV